MLKFWWKSILCVWSYDRLLGHISLRLYVMTYVEILIKIHTLSQVVWLPIGTQFTSFIYNDVCWNFDKNLHFVRSYELTGWIWITNSGRIGPNSGRIRILLWPVFAPSWSKFAPSCKWSHKSISNFVIIGFVVFSRCGILSSLRRYQFRPGKPTIFLGITLAMDLNFWEFS